MVQQEAVSYLRRLAPTFQRQSVAVTAEVARGDPAGVITDTAQAIQADVIVLGTHGKAGMDAFWSGSLSPILAGRLRLPLLLVPVVQSHQRT
jgi:nucleotide-binding universal stress UspA family protein